MNNGPVFSYAVPKQPQAAGAHGGNDDDDEAGEGDMNGEATMNGDARMNAANSMGHMPLTSDPSVKMASPDRDEPSAFNEMNGGHAATSGPSPAVMRTKTATTVAPPTQPPRAAPGGKRAALIKAVLAAGDIGLQTEAEDDEVARPAPHASMADMQADHSMEMADMSHVRTTSPPSSTTTAAAMPPHTSAGVPGFMDAGDPNEPDIMGQMNAPQSP